MRTAIAMLVLLLLILLSLAGCAARPTDVATCVRDATSAVVKALQFCQE